LFLSKETLKKVAIKKSLAPKDSLIPLENVQKINICKFTFHAPIPRLVQSSPIEPKRFVSFTVCAGLMPITQSNCVVQSARVNQPIWDLIPSGDGQGVYLLAMYFVSIPLEEFEEFI